MCLHLVIGRTVALKYCILYIENVYHTIVRQYIFIALTTKSQRYLYRHFHRFASKIIIKIYLYYTKTSVLLFKKKKIFKSKIQRFVK